jgi:WD40 repeat protein
VQLDGVFDVAFDLADLSRKLTETGVHDILGEIYDLWQQQDPAGNLEELEQLQKLHCCLGRHLVVLKKPPMDMRKTLVQLASQEPVGTRLLREAEAALRGLQQEVIMWVNKPSAPLPCVMEIREHSRAVLSVAVSPDGKWIASGSEDKTVKVVERKTGRVKCTLSGHSGYATAVSYSCLFSKVWCVLTIEHFTGMSGVFASLQTANNLLVEARTAPSRYGRRRLARACRR